MDSLPRHPPRLHHLFSAYTSPLYFVTVCTFDRKPFLADTALHETFLEYGRASSLRGIAIGRYVIMPDHLHVFLRLDPARYRLGTTVGMLKKALSACLAAHGQPPPHWQPGFFDRVMRHSESYAEKWEYIRQNPVRAGLVVRPEEWPYAGEVVRIPW